VHLYGQPAYRLMETRLLGRFLGLIDRTFELKSRQLTTYGHMSPCGHLDNLSDPLLAADEMGIDPDAVRQLI
jgi:hypothetical protein